MLNYRQRAFVEAYCGDAQAAAIAAGYSPKTAKVVGCRMLKNPEIAGLIEAREMARASAAVATREERQAFWTAVMRDPAEPMKNRLRASELLGRCCGDFLERVELTKPEPPIIQVVFTDEIDDEEDERAELSADDEL